MPRRFFKRHAPDPETLKQTRHLRWLGRSLEDPNCWHVNRQSVSRAFLIGFIVAFMPIPMQMLVAGVCALRFHANLPIAVGLVWMTNPITFAPMFYAAYRVGTALLNIDPVAISFDGGLSAISSQLADIWLPMLLGCAVCGVMSGLLAHAIVWRVWRWQVLSRWQERKRRRKLRRQQRRTELTKN
ncbi:MAG: DUF2062 domain-containing protein [Pseudomonadales bacterium]